MLSLALAVVLAAVPVLPDHLEPVTSGVFADLNANTPEAAYHRLLLIHPRRELQVVTHPAFDLEQAVYVTTDAQGRSTVHFAQFTNSARRLEAKRVLPDGGGWSAADVWRAEAPISPTLVTKLKTLWSLALARTRRPDKLLIQKDGVHHFFFEILGPSSSRVGRTTDQLDEKSKMSALIRLSDRLGFLARCAPADRAAVELELDDAVQSLRARFLRESVDGGSNGG